MEQSPKPNTNAFAGGLDDLVTIGFQFFGGEGTAERLLEEWVENKWDEKK